MTARFLVLPVLAVLALSACKSEETIAGEAARIASALPEGCEMMDLGAYDEVRQVIAVRCDGRPVTTVTTGTPEPKQSDHLNATVMMEMPYTAPPAPSAQENASDIPQAPDYNSLLEWFEDAGHRAPNTSRDAGLTVRVPAVRGFLSDMTLECYKFENSVRSTLSHAFVEVGGTVPTFVDEAAHKLCEMRAAEF